MEQYRDDPKNSTESDRLSKLLARALDPSATSGEAENAGIKAVREARRRRLDVAGFAEAIGTTRQIEYRERVVYRDRHVDPLAEYRRFIFPFGKYEGCTVGDVWACCPSYCRWFALNIQDADPALMEAVAAVAGIETAEVAA